MARRNKGSAALKAGITFTSFLTQLAEMGDDGEGKKKLRNTNRLLKALRNLMGIEN